MQSFHNGNFTQVKIDQEYSQQVLSCQSEPNFQAFAVEICLKRGKIWLEWDSSGTGDDVVTFINFLVALKDNFPGYFPRHRKRNICQQLHF